MTKINIVRLCKNTVESNAPAVTDWGLRFLVDSEIDALRIAYAYRKNPYGVKVDHCPSVDQFMVTVWNEFAKGTGCDV